MTEKETEDWFKKFDETKDKFKWFWDYYIAEELWEQLMKAREEKDQNEMLCIMNGVWFDLPDGRFNIQNNPAGWKEFLYLIED